MVDLYHLGYELNPCGCLLDGIQNYIRLGLTYHAVYIKISIILFYL